MANELVLLTQWRERLKRQSESGLTVEAFCQQEGVSTSMFYRWQRQLQRQTSEATSARPVGMAKPARKRRGKASPRQVVENCAGQRTGDRASAGVSCDCPCAACGRCRGSS